MADRFPLILNTSTNQIQEIPSGDSLDLTGSGIANAGIITAGNVIIGAASTDLIVNGDARITGILTIGTSSLKFDGPNNLVNVGTALTLGHSQGLQFHTQNLHSAGFEVNQINVSGASTIGGNLDANGDLDVDGHTNLDNVSVAGVSTFAGNADFSAGIDVTGNLIASGNLTANNGTVTVSGTAPKITFTETNDNPDYKLEANGGNIAFVDTTNSATRLSISSSGINVTGNGTFSGNVSIGGTLTYEDVTNIDSIGIITARNGINVSSGTATFQGAIDANGDLDVDGHTNLDNVSVAGVSTFSDDVTFETANGNNIVFDKSANKLLYGNNVIAAFGTGGSSGLLEIQSNSSGGCSITEKGGGDLTIQSTGTGIIFQKAGTSEVLAKMKTDAEVELYHNAVQKFETSSTGVTVTGTVVATGADINGDIDVDGHTNLDNVNIVGVVTVSQQVHTFAQQITGDNQDSLDFTGSSTNQNRGIAFNGATALSAEQNKTWLRLNNNGEFSNGTYTPGLFRADGGFDTDGNTIVTSTGQINGSRILTGTIPVAQIGTGTKNTSTFYRGDGTFATVTAPAITAINGAANNYVVVSDGGTTVTAESQLRFNGTHLAVGNISPGDHYYSRGIACHAAGVGSVLHLTDSVSGSGQDNGFDVLSHDNSAYLWQRETGPMYFGVGANTKWIMENSGTFYPNGNGNQDIGKSTNRVQNLYTSDLHLSNEAKGGNSIDNTWGDYTIQEGESDLFLINNRSGKKYKFNLTEVS